MEALTEQMQELMGAFQDVKVQQTSMKVNFTAGLWL